VTNTSGFVIKVVHRRVSRYLKRQEKRTQQAFWEALEHICRGPFPKDDPVHITHLKGPFHCSYRYALGKGKQSQRIKYDVDVVSREITVYDLGPRGDAYKTQ
jgi:mRNA-degrading endonuclease RelE of RelBE toxin-antitoxin system